MNLRTPVSALTLATAAVGMTMALATPGEAAAAVTTRPVQFSVGESSTSARRSDTVASLPFEFENQPWFH